jgi:hypothetical protein
MLNFWLHSLRKLVLLVALTIVLHVNGSAQHGAAGYGKHYGAAFADGTIENFMTGAVFPSVLRNPCFSGDCLINSVRT